MAHSWPMPRPWPMPGPRPLALCRGRTAVDDCREAWGRGWGTAQGPGEGPQWVQHMARAWAMHGMGIGNQWAISKQTT